ncbi:hypothetical protein [Nocardia carnea]|uniref:hypothetical protein n=1 Tax=Nocardia carnea TaxID=37328 RepID=UPI0024585403|nr:hypothetical protein [Nocardia carnea]
MTQQTSPTNSQPQKVRIGSTIYRCSTLIHGIFTVRRRIIAENVRSIRFPAVVSPFTPPRRKPYSGPGLPEPM